MEVAPYQIVTTLYLVNIIENDKLSWEICSSKVALFLHPAILFPVRGCDREICH